MVIVAEPMDEEEVERRQTGNKRDLADFLEALDKQMKGGEGAVPLFKDLGDQGKESEKEAIPSDEDEGVQNNIQKEEEADDEGVEDHGEDDLQEPEESESEEDDDLSDVEDARDIKPNQGVRGSIEEDAVGALEGNPEADTGAIGLAGVSNKKVEEPEKFPEMYVQVMYIKNYVNEKPVPRPTRLKKDDSWKVAVAIDELPPKPAYLTNIGVVKRRKRVIEHRMVTEDDAEAGAYIRQLRNMSRAGRDWAKAQEEMFPGEPVLYKPRLG